MGKMPFGGNLSFGYRKNNKGEIVLDKTDSMIVQFIYQKWNELSKKRHLTKTKKTQLLLTLLKKKGYKFHNKDFQRHNLRDILSNSLYCGIIKWKKKQNKSVYPTIVSKRLFNLVGVA